MRFFTLFYNVADLGNDWNEMVVNTFDSRDYVENEQYTCTGGVSFEVGLLVD